jgi:signal transduction histidine kinase
LENQELTSVLDAIPHLVIVVNQQRQIVYANRHVLEAMGGQQLRDVYGMRPGELMGCARAFEGAGCGHSEMCQACGGDKTFRGCLRGERGTHECRIIPVDGGRATDFRISGSPIEVRGERFAVLTLTDIGHEKRRQALERIFFHDLLNLATGIVGYSAVLNRVRGGEAADEAAHAIPKLVRQLADEIKGQRQLTEAESDELTPYLEPLSSGDVLNNVVTALLAHEAARDRLLVADPDSQDVTFTSDRTLLGRVLANMVKNGLEAVGPGERVTIACRADDETLEFRVHNPGEMPREVQLQVFQRLFSTKGCGRGLGTYSIKLLTERYLGGRVGFTSSAAEGTIFWARYPRDPS